MDAAPNDTGAAPVQSALGEVCEAAVNAASSLPLTDARCVVLCFQPNGDVEVHAVSDAYDLCSDGDTLAIPPSSPSSDSQDSPDVRHWTVGPG